MTLQKFSHSIVKKEKFWYNNFTDVKNGKLSKLIKKEKINYGRNKKQTN